MGGLEETQHASFTPRKPHKDPELPDSSLSLAASPRSLQNPSTASPNSQTEALYKPLRDPVPQNLFGPLFFQIEAQTHDAGDHR